MAHPHVEHRAEHHERAHGLIARTGNRSIKHRARGGSVEHEDAAADAKMVAKGVHEHEAAMHKGERETKLKLKSGGHVDGEHGKHHLAKRARGGGLGKHGGKNTKVNVIVAPQGGGAGGGDVQAAHQQGMQQGAQLGARAAMSRMGGAGGPPAAGGAGPPAPPAGGMAPGAGPAVRPGMGMAPPGAGMMRKRGGAVHMEAGAGGGEGRIEKADEYGKGGFKPKDKMSR